MYTLVYMYDMQQSLPDMDKEKITVNYQYLNIQFTLSSEMAR